MQTRLSTKGQVVLPVPLRRKLGLRAGDPLDASINEGRIVLTLRRPAARRARIIEDQLIGTPVLSFGTNSPVLTTREVEEILAEYP